MEICLSYRFTTFNIKVIFAKLALETDSYIRVEFESAGGLFVCRLDPTADRGEVRGNLPIEILKFTTPSQVFMRSGLCARDYPLWVS